jgi:hypothetical protein
VLNANTVMNVKIDVVVLDTLHKYYFDVNIPVSPTFLRQVAQRFFFFCFPLVSLSDELESSRPNFEAASSSPSPDVTELPPLAPPSSSAAA